MTTYYTLEPRRISYRELWRICPNVIVFGVVAVLKTIRVSFGDGPLVPLIERVHDGPWDDLPDDARAALAAPVAAWERAGFRRVFVHQLPSVQKVRALTAVALLAPDRLAFAVVTHLRRPDRTFTSNAVFTLFRDGVAGHTTDQRHELDDPPGLLRAQQPPGLAPAELWGRHRATVDGPWLAAGHDPERLDDEMVRATYVELERREIAFNLARGVLVPVTDEEFEKYADPD